MNKITLTGRITDALELKKTTNDKSVIEFTIAVTRPFKREEADFIRVQLWNQNADFLAQYARKGTLIGVEGNLRVDQYEKDGNKHYKTYVQGERCEILSQPAEKKETKPVETSEPVQTITREQGMGGTTFDGISPDDLPFY